jgi:hypothetical protein
MRELATYMFYDTFILIHVSPKIIHSLSRSLYPVNA